MAASDWLPVLAGGVGGASVTSVWSDWRQRSANLHENRKRFHAERLEVASSLLAQAGQMLRLQAKLAALRPAGLREGEDGSGIVAEYQQTAQTCRLLSARFELLFPQEQRNQMSTLMATVDRLHDSVADGSGYGEAFRAANAAMRELAAACRVLLDVDR